METPRDFIVEPGDLPPGVRFQPLGTYRGLERVMKPSASFWLARKPPIATSYYTLEDAAAAATDFLRTMRPALASAELIFSLWPQRPSPEGGGAAPGWIVESREAGIHQGWICDGRTSGPYTYPIGAQERAPR